MLITVHCRPFAVHALSVQLVIVFLRARPDARCDFGVCVHLHSSQLLPYFVSSCAHHHLSYWPTAAAAVAAAAR